MQNTPLEDEIGDKAARELLAHEKLQASRKYSPSPWRLTETRTETSIVDANGFTVMSSMPFYLETPSSSEDWHLIKTAPELLETLQEVVRISDRDHIAWLKAKDVIAKALGE